MAIPLTVVLITKNEEKRLRPSLESIKGWADEIIIVDDESTDSTRELAAEYTDKIFIRKMDVEGTHRNWGYAKAGNRWVLTLDADEALTPELKEEIAEAITCDRFTHYSMPSYVYIGTYCLKMEWDRGKVKLFQKDKFRYEDVSVHPRIITEGEGGHLRGKVIHYSYRDFADYLVKLNGQTTLEAEKWFNIYKRDPKWGNRKMNFPHAIWRMIDRFFRTYFSRKGYRDGFVGFMLSFCSGLYQIYAYAKFWELKRDESDLS